MINTLNEFYDAIKKEAKNSSAYINETGNIIIYCQKKNNRIIGITSNGEWFVEIDTKFYLLKELKPFYKLISILEIPFETIEEEINERFKMAEINFDARYIFPFYPIVERVFQKPQSLYWLELAYSWYELLDDKQKYGLIPIIQDLNMNTKLSQKLRQKMRKSMNELRKS